MPSIAAITINDGQTTPVAKYFVPSAKYPVTVWENATGSFPSAYPRFTAQSSKNPKSGLFRGKWGLTVPAVDTLGAVVNASRINVEIIHAANSTAQQRKDAFAFFLNWWQTTGAASFGRDMEGYF